MTVRNFPDSDSSDNALALAEANTRQRQSMQTSPDVAANAANLQAQYPHLPPDAIMPLAQQGMNANSPGMDQIANAAAKAKVKKGFGWHSIGDFVKAGVHDAVNIALGPPKLFVNATKASAETAKPIIRGAGIAANFGLQEMEGEGRSVGGAIHKYGVLGAFAPRNVFSGDPIYNAPDQTDLGQVNKQAIDQVEHGVGHVDTGSGFLAGGTAHTAQTQAARDTWSIGGQAATPGRVVANIATEPGTKPYNLLSGLVDAGVSWYGDPAAKGLKAIGDARKAKTLLSGGAPTVVESVVKGGDKATTEASTVENATNDVATAVTAPINPQRSLLQKQLFEAQARFDRDPTHPNAYQHEGMVAKLKQQLNDLDNADTVHPSPAPTATEQKIVTNGESEWTPTASQEHREASGLLDGTRRTVMPANAVNWLQSENGRKVVERIAGTQSYAELRRTFSNGKDIDVDTLNELSKANTTDDVLNIIKPTLGIEVREAPELPGTLRNATTNTFQTLFRRDPRDVRLLQQMPGTHIDVNDKNQAVSTLDNFFKNAKISQDVADTHINAMADAQGPIAMYKATDNAIGAVGDHLASLNGIKKSQARQMTQMFSDYRQELAKYFVDEVGDNVPVLGAKIDGADRALPTPHIPSEYINRAIPLPDARAIRKATGTYARIIRGLEGSDSQAVNTLGKAVDRSGQAIGVGAAGIDHLQQDIWKPLVLLRGAYPIRVVGEEQARMAASGLDSMLAHPISAIAWAAGRKGNLDAAGHEFTDDASAAGDMEAFAASQSHGSAGWRNRLTMKHRVLYDREHDEHYPDAWANEIDQLRADPLGRRAAGGWSKTDEVPQGFTGNNGEDLKRWFWSGSGAALRKTLSEAEGREGLLNDQNVADAYIDSIVKRISIKTQDDPNLINGIATGKITNDSGKSVALRSGPGQISSRFKEHLQSLAEQGIGPQKVQGQMVISKGGKAVGHYDKAVELAFNALMSKPTNYLSRSPAFKQFYWQRTGELYPYLDKASQEKALASAKAANIDKNDIAQMTRYGDVSGTLGLKDADLLAKGHALDHTRKLLYDMTQKSQFFDITRNIFPFGDAWKEVFHVWSHIGMSNPQIFRRAQQLATGATQSGFFFQDPTTGQESFKYPGTGLLSQGLLGVPVPLTGTVNGLNIFGGVTPGFGPSVQWAANSLLPDKPQFDQVKHLISPFGGGNDDSGVVESYLPAWAQKLRQAGVTPFGRQDDRVWNNTVSSVAAELVSTGKYNTNSQENVNALMTAAKSKAKELYLIRAAAQFFAPSAPSPQFLAADKDGKMTYTAKLVEDFYNMEQADYKNATQNFIDKYGVQNLLTIQGKSTSNTPSTKEDYNFEREHPELASTYSNVIGFFAPPGNTYDPTAAARQFKTGQRQALKPEEVVAAANSRLASTIWRTASDKLAGRTDTAATRAKDDLREYLMQQYPGWNPVPANMGQTGATIQQIQSAIRNPALGSTDAGKAAATYLQARNEVQQIAKNRGLSSWTQAKNAKDLRDAMRNVGTALEKQTPAFGNMWDYVFSREMASDDSSN